MRVVGPVGIEPTTNRLKAYCSASELRSSILVELCTRRVSCDTSAVSQPRKADQFWLVSADKVLNVQAAITMTTKAANNLLLIILSFGAQ